MTVLANRRDPAEYPSLLRRYLATLTDVSVLGGVIYLLVRAPLISESAQVTGTLVIAAILAYEPVLTSYYRTIGQQLMGIRVRTINNHERIHLGQAYLRLVIKYLFGWFSLLTIPARADRRAMHDLASDSIVLHAKRCD